MTVKKYVWRFASFFFGLITIACVVEFAQEVYSMGTSPDTLLGVVITSTAGILTMVCHDRASKEVPSDNK